MVYIMYKYNINRINIIIFIIFNIIFIYMLCFSDREIFNTNIIE